MKKKLVVHFPIQATPLNSIYTFHLFRSLEIPLDHFGISLLIFQWLTIRLAETNESRIMKT